MKAFYWDKVLKKSSISKIHPPIFSKSVEIFTSVEAFRYIYVCVPNNSCKFICSRNNHRIVCRHHNVQHSGLCNSTTVRRRFDAEKALKKVRILRRRNFDVFQGFDEFSTNFRHFPTVFNFK